MTRRAEGWSIQRRAYLYVYDFASGNIAVLTYPAGKHIRILRDAGSMCTDPKSGHLYVIRRRWIDEYAPGGSRRNRSVRLPHLYRGAACAVDPATSRVAVIGRKSIGSRLSEAVVLVYSALDEDPSTYVDSSQPFFQHGGYDSSGNLFVDTYEAFEELPKGAIFFTRINLKKQLLDVGTVQWDGSYITLEVPNPRVKIYRIAISGSTGTIVSQEKLGKLLFRLPVYTWIDGNRVVTPWGVHGTYSKIRYWSYPVPGTKPERVLSGFDHAAALVTGVK